MGFLGDLVGKVVGKESSEGSQAVKDEELARLYEACSCGHLPTVPDPPIILKRGETAHFVASVSVIEQKTETTTYRGYAGTRFKIGSLPIYLGGSAPSKVSNEVMAPVGERHLIITNKRVVLTGTKINYSTPLDRITNWNLFKDAIQILWEGKYGGRFYKMDDPRPASIILKALVSGIPQQPLSFIQAAVNGRDLVRGLSQSGADIDQRADEGYTALMFVSYNGDKSMAEFLLEAGANINAVSEDGSTALMMAAFGGQSEMVRYLITRGADINAKTDGGVTAVTAAAEGGHQDVIKLLLDAGAKEAPKPISPQNPDSLVGAASAGRSDIVTQLLDQGADANVSTDAGLTPLMAAANQGHVATLEILLTRGAEIDKKDGNGLTALMVAASEGRTDAVKILTERGAKVNLKSKQEATPLMFASLNGHYEVVEVLLKAGAKPNVKTKDGRTALGAAEYGRHQETTEFLKTHGGK